MRKFLLSALLTIAAAIPALSQSPEYHIDANGVSREVLENYLDHSITMVYLLMPDKPEGRRVYTYHPDDVRMVKETGAKFLGRAIYRWGGESLLNDPNFWARAREIATDLHAADPDIVLQGCLFEIITTDVNNVPVPAWVFEHFGLPVEKRNFSYDAMLNPDGKLVNHWHKGSSVPDVSQLETKLWFTYLAGAYMEVGVEALHLGQIELIGMNDPDRDNWAEVIGHIRSVARDKGRRGWVLLDAHTPYFGMVKDGVSLIDFNSFPLRIREIPETPFHGELQKGYLDSLYGRSMACKSPSGWSAKHLPYLVEFDNFGISREPGKANLDSHFVWGWDEISWFAQQPEEYRNQWLRYAWQWLRDNDPNGHLEMPGTRMITCPNESDGSYRAARRSPSCPIGYSQENVISSLWSTH